MVGDIIERQFKGSLNRNLGAAMSLILMLLVFVSIGLMNRFSGDDEEVAEAALELARECALAEIAARRKAPEDGKIEAHSKVIR